MSPTAPNKPSIEFSVVSGSNDDLIIDCLTSLREGLTEGDYEWCVTATCNTSGTGLAERLKTLFPGIRILVNPSPRGFAANHNRVIRESTADYVWILNDDLVFFPDTVKRVTDYMELPANSRVAAVSPRLLNTDGTLQPSTYSFPSMPQTILAHSGIREHPLVNRIVARLAPILRPRVGSSRFWGHDRTIEVDTFRGACVAVRMKAVREVGPMMEAALVGAEEIEWHRRFRQAGWKVVFLAEASVIHHGSQTVGNGAQHQPEYLKATLEYFRNGSSPLAYRALCWSLWSMFEARRAVASVRRDASARQNAVLCSRVARDALRPGKSPPSENLAAPLDP